MLQEQLDALLSDGEAASQQQQVSTRVVLVNKLQRAAASLPPPSLAGQTGGSSAGPGQHTGRT